MLSEANLARIQSAGDSVTTTTRVQLWANSVRPYGAPSVSAQAPKQDAVATRQPFAEVVSNAQRPKRKAVESSIRTNPSRECKKQKTVMEGAQRGKDANTGPRKRGRPPKNRQPDTAPRGGKGQTPAVPPTYAVEQNRTAIPPLELPTPDARSRSASPKKKGKAGSQAKVDARIGTADLRFCNPSVNFQKYEKVRASGDPLPSPVAGLLDALDRIRMGFIPHELKDSYDKESNTPRKTRVPPHQKEYADEIVWDLSTQRMDRLKEIVEDVVDIADWNHENKVHERQWADTTVTPLIAEVRSWPRNRKLIPLNVEYCQILPYDIRMTHPTPNNAFEYLPPVVSAPTTTSLSQDGELTVARMVDKSIGLLLDKNDRKIIERAFKFMVVNDRSVNQSLTYIQMTPLVFDIELKKTLSDRDPEVQLAVWKAAYYSKLLHHGWDTSLPMPCIAVNGHNWDYYIGYVEDETLIMMGPRRFGSTVDVNGTFEIVHKLNVLMNWGEDKYRTWFNNTVLAWMKARIEKAETRSM